MSQGGVPFLIMAEDMAGDDMSRTKSGAELTRTANAKSLLGWLSISAVLYVFETGLVWGTFLAVLGSGRELTAPIYAGFAATFAAHQLAFFGTSILVAKLFELSLIRPALITVLMLALFALPTLFLLGFATACATRPGCGG